MSVGLTEARFSPVTAFYPQLHSELALGRALLPPGAVCLEPSALGELQRGIAGRCWGEAADGIRQVGDGY